MRVLLDTHVFLWAITQDRKLSKKAQSVILGASEVYVSSASIWEIAIKIQLKKLPFDLEKIIHSIEASDFSSLPITIEHAHKVGSLEKIHRDPFDRILVAQALYEPLTLLTADALLLKYSKAIQLV